MGTRRKSPCPKVSPAQKVPEIVVSVREKLRREAREVRGWELG